MTPRAHRLKRRDFLRRSAAGALLGLGAGAFPAPVLAQSDSPQAQSGSPNERVNLAVIGVANRGAVLLELVQHQNIVALCDVDARHLGQAAARFPKARRFTDFRIMLQEMQQRIDAVIVASTDHTHLPASVMAMRLGKGVYCEKPLGHNIREVRLATQVAQRYGVPTQMGNGAHSGYNYRSVAAMIKAGVIGRVSEVHAWCDQAWAPGYRPAATPPVPAYMNWDLWLGPAPVRPYHPCYHPMAWRNWWDFGNGRLGDMGCHMIDLPFTALDLKYPVSVEAMGPKPNPESSPPWLICKWNFPARGELPPVELTWYDGDKRPALQREHHMPDYPEGVLFVGSEGMLIADYGRMKLYPEAKFAGVARPRLEPGLGHMEEWLAACKAGGPTGTHFGYSGPLTETVLLGTVAHRVGRKIKWDGANLRVTNDAEANALIHRPAREGWAL